MLKFEAFFFCLSGITVTLSFCLCHNSFIMQDRAHYTINRHPRPVPSHHLEMLREEKPWNTITKNNSPDMLIEVAALQPRLGLRLYQIFSFSAQSCNKGGDIKYRFYQ